MPLSDAAASSGAGPGRSAVARPKPTVSVVVSSWNVGIMDQWKGPRVKKASEGIHDIFDQGDEYVADAPLPASCPTAHFSYHLVQ